MMDSFVSNTVAIAMQDPALCVIVECAINILLTEQGHEKARPATDILSHHSTEVKAKALKTVNKLAGDEEYQDVATKIAAMLRGEVTENG